MYEWERSTISKQAEELVVVVEMWLLRETARDVMDRHTHTHTILKKL